MCILELHGSLAVRLLTIAKVISYTTLKIYWVQENEIDSDFTKIYDVPKGCEFIDEKTATDYKTSSKVVTSFHKEMIGTNVYFIADSTFFKEQIDVLPSQDFLKSLKLQKNLMHIFLQDASCSLHPDTIGLYITHESLADKHALTSAMCEIVCRNKNTNFLLSSVTSYYFYKFRTDLISRYCVTYCQQVALEIQLFSKTKHFLGTSACPFSEMVSLLCKSSQLIERFSCTEVCEIPYVCPINEASLSTKCCMEKGKVKIYYEDVGFGKPVILIHGWPLSGRSWEKQVTFLVSAGYRVITYDRRGFGWSSQPYSGYDYDTFASDLHSLILSLNLRDVTLVGFSMGGGEVARYIGKYGTSNVCKAVFAAAVPPYLLGSGGISTETVSNIQTSIIEDRQSFLKTFVTNFFTASGNIGVSDEVLHYFYDIAKFASPKGTLDCVKAFSETDFRPDLKKFSSLPTLVIHGDADMIVPYNNSGALMQTYISNCQSHVIKNGSHGINQCNSAEFNSVLLAFLKMK